MNVVAIILATLIAFGLWEYFLLRMYHKQVPMRIHVNGTRGKSSVTRLVAAGFRAGGTSTCAKTTGTRPRMILEDGSEYSIQRQGRANILEQVRALAVSSRRKAQALVAECMALNPHYQYLCEHTMLRSKIGVITNARADHLEIMGPTVLDAAMAMAGTTPTNGTLVTGETDPEMLWVLKTACQREKSQLVIATPESERITEDIMRKFSYIEHPENVAVALKVCKLAGIDEKKAISGMLSAEPDLGALRIVRLAFFAKKINFVNAFAANDPESTLSIWNRILALFPPEKAQRKVAILNCRSDRPARSTQLGKLLPAMKQLDSTLLVGSGTRLANEAILSKGVHPEKIILMENAPAGRVFERALAKLGKSGLVFGMGNIGGNGNEIVEYFQNRAFDPVEGEKEQA
jgi:poly-gamma-glutamate synthase PgsB/CapB